MDNKKKQIGHVANHFPVYPDCYVALPGPEYEQREGEYKYSDFVQGCSRKTK